jgi:threonine/homoserine/homoserine lactone efflux protein
MSWHGLTLFCLVHCTATATPGPGIAALVARVLGRGTHGLPAFLAGFVVGNLTWFALAATGMAALAHAARSLGEEAVAVRNEGRLQAFAGAVALTLGNPKVMGFFLAVQWLNRASGTVMAGAAAGVAAQ